MLDRPPAAVTAPAAAGPQRRNAARTQRQLLEAACAEFADKGLQGARIDEIAVRAGVNKQLVYHHFGSKEDLYQAVLEDLYTRIREDERRLDLDHLEPAMAMRRLVEFSFDYLLRHPEFVALLTDENLHKARHVHRSARLQSLHSPFIATIAATLKRGELSGEFRPGVDAVQFYISVAGLCFFYFSNLHTLSAIFSRDLSRRPALRRRRQHVVDFVMAYLTPPPLG